MSNKNDITGDTIVNNKGNTAKYAAGWERIFGKNKQDGNTGTSRGETTYVESVSIPTSSIADRN